MQQFVNLILQTLGPNVVLLWICDHLVGSEKGPKLYAQILTVIQSFTAPPASLPGVFPTPAPAAPGLASPAVHTP